MGRIIIVQREDLKNYPPTLSIINYLLMKNVKIIVIGYFTDVYQRKILESQGVEFLGVCHYNEGGNKSIINRILEQFKLKREILSHLNKLKISDDDRVWIMQGQLVALLSSVVGKYKTIVHLYEHVGNAIYRKYKLFNPSFNAAKTFNSAFKVVCCEYNRAHILRSIYKLEKLPIILPNKFFSLSNQTLAQRSSNEYLVSDLAQKLSGKFIILYQGSFLGLDRKLDEYCEAVLLLPDDFVLIAMGPNHGYYNELKSKYQSDRIIFVPFINPPFHLEVTKLAHIGILSYISNSTILDEIINPLYCAPNKIFEYSKFGIPMISNDLPGLHSIFREYNCGECVDYPITPSKIAMKIKQIRESYTKYSDGSRTYYESVSISDIIERILV